MVVRPGRVRVWAKQFSSARVVYRALQRSGRHGRVLSAMPIFTPNSAGGRAIRSDLALMAANQTLPFLVEVLRLSGTEPLSIISAQAFNSSGKGRIAAGELAVLFDAYGSDKATPNNYHYIYGEVIADLDHVGSILEVGLGTNNTDVPSNMGAAGKPGASLRAFREHLPTTNVFGADIDKRVLFSEEGIQTFFVDQTNLESVSQLELQLPDSLDVVIDDGLHAPNANLAICMLGLRKVRVGGWIVIEDIVPAALPVWQLVGAMLASTYDCHVIDTGNALVFAAKRTA